MQGQRLFDALSELEAAGLISGDSDPANHFAPFRIGVLSWEHVTSEVVGYSVEEDKKCVAATVVAHRIANRETIIQDTQLLPEKRVDIAVFLLEARGHVRVIRPYASDLPFDVVIGSRETEVWLSRLRSLPVQPEDINPRRLQYDISVRCLTCQQTLFERRSYGAESHQRDQEKAQEIARSAGSTHPGHTIELKMGPRL